LFRVADEQATERAPAYPIGSVDNALRVLLLLRSRPRLRVADCAREIGVARSSAHRAISTAPRSIPCSYTSAPACVIGAVYPYEGGFVT
jgi:hypothetical protein